jgi:hypothetical protein
MITPGQRLRDLMEEIELGVLQAIELLGTVVAPAVRHATAETTAATNS